MRVRAIALGGALVATLAGCGTLPPASVEDVRRALGPSLPGAIGATPADQAKIDETIAGACGAGIYTRAECRAHGAALAAAGSH